MNHPFYFVVSWIVGIAIIMIIMRLNFFAQDVRSETHQEEILLMNFMTTQQIIEYHLKKVGFKAKKSPILYADSTGIAFLSDEDNDTIVDTVEIKKGVFNQSTDNPDDFSLIVKVDGNEREIIPGSVTRFKLEYFDINGRPTTEKLFIKRIKIVMRLESDIKINDHYLTLEREFYLTPKNL